MESETAPEFVTVNLDGDRVYLTWIIGQGTRNGTNQ
jgi:hypothetical protein